METCFARPNCAVEQDDEYHVAARNHHLHIRNCVTARAQRLQRCPRTGGAAVIQIPERAAAAREDEKQVVVGIRRHVEVRAVGIRTRGRQSGVQQRGQPRGAGAPAILGNSIS